jgi:adenosylmethionine-8-amino-7-oxononanoate aminotransferase
LEKALGSHPNVGEIRGRGLFQSIEFVADRKTKSTFPVDVKLSAMLNDAIFDCGALVYSGFGKGTADGLRGDHILPSPPLNITSEQVDEMVVAIKAGVEDVFSRPKVVKAAARAEPWIL